ncbi:MAG: SusD/RagB family nutrient-binding outer membrane lipoprotein [Bacteroidota bacterium]
MKFITKIFVVALFAAAFSACDNTELALQENPNAITADKASVNDLYNSIQLTFSGFISGLQGTDGPGGMARMYNSNNSFSYDATIAPTTLSGLWFNAYSGMYPDIEALDVIAAERGLDIHSGSSKIMKAYTLMAMVDVFGNIPFSEAGKGTDIIAPVADPGESVYDAAIALLDAAIAQLDGTTAAAPANDIIYGGDAAKWITAAKTLKLRAAVTTRLTDPSGAASVINDLVSDGDLISDASQDFQWNYGNQRTNPNSRHPFYNNHYELGDGVYLSNYYMWLLRADKEDMDGNAVIDPRIRFYFYRKVEKAEAQDQTTYSCHFSALPDKTTTAGAIAHYDAVDPDLPYCIVIPGDGYSGRDHMNGEGIPPDGPIRTSFGLYPAGGQFDLSGFVDSRQQGTTGGMGQGIWPIMTASFTDFLRAEAALTVGTTDDAKALLESGIRKSISKVFSFTSLVSGTMSTIIDARPCSGTSVQDCFVPSDEDVEAYVQFVMDEYDAADDKLNIVMREYYIALWGNGLEAYNMFRRTGKPNNMQPAIEPAPGDFPVSYLYPDVYIQRNKNATQKAITDRVFWDDGSAKVY